MSASLVGSEMCIRDRCRALMSPWRWRAANRRELGRIEVDLRLCRLVLWGCLLYTSDAADDISV
eukprot:1644127-Alexandrium_andersonii.AAC.1